MEAAMVSIFNQPIEQVDPPRSPQEVLPTMYDLPSEDPEELGLPDEFHDLQPQLLSRTLRLNDYSIEHWFAGSDLNLYYDIKHPKWQKRPDWFLAVDVPRLYEGTEMRRSYVTWQEGESPSVVIEFLSPGTEDEDLGRFHAIESQQAQTSVAKDTIAKDITAKDISTTSAIANGTSRIKRQKPPSKFEVYERYLRVPHYIVYSRRTQLLRYFKLVGSRYQEQTISDNDPRIWLDDLSIGLGIWQGRFEHVPGYWLRWCDRQGDFYLTDTEQEKQQKEQAETKLLQGARNLLAMGMEASQVSELLELSIEKVQQLLSE
jgi:Uma2 family endonuclease